MLLSLPTGKLRQDLVRVASRWPEAVRLVRWGERDSGPQPAQEGELLEDAPQPLRIASGHELTPLALH
jgi:hypothetical protein